MVNIVIINGLGGCGKSTFAEMCTKYCNENKRAIVAELSTVDYVKIVARLCGWDGSKSEKDRIFLSDLKKAFAKWNNIPIKYVFDQINDIISKEKTKKNYLFFVNSREPDDIKEIIELAKLKGYKALTVKLERPNQNVNEVPELINDIVNMKADHTIVNSGELQDLQNKAISFVENLIH